MKKLIVLHIGGKNNIDKILKQQNELKSFCKNCNSKSDIYLYSSDLENDFDNKFFSGKVFFQSFKFLSPLAISNEILSLKEIQNYEQIILAEDDFCNDIAVLLAAKLNYKCITNVQDIKLLDDYNVYTRFSYNNNLLIDYKIKENSVISLRGFKSKKIDLYTEDLDFINLKTINDCEYIISNKIIQKANDIVDSDILIAVGMGINSKQEINDIRNYALSNGFSFGVTRPIAMRGWASLGEIIGVSGNIFSPKICITIGVSGSAAFYVGIENSEYILSINNDEDAPIISLSNTNIVNDYKKIIKSILSYLQNYNKRFK